MRKTCRVHLKNSQYNKTQIIGFLSALLFSSVNISLICRFFRYTFGLIFSLLYCDFLLISSKGRYANYYKFYEIPSKLTINFSWWLLANVGNKRVKNFVTQSCSHQDGVSLKRFHRSTQFRQHYPSSNGTLAFLQITTEVD